MDVKPLPTSQGSSDPPNIELNIPTKTRMTIGGQPIPVRPVIRRANTYDMPRVICFDHAFPLADHKTSLLAEAVINAAKHLGPSAAIIHERLLSDDAYVLGMSIIPDFRMSNFRLKFKEFADASVKQMYSFAKFPDGQFCASIGKLLNDHSYVFPPKTSVLTFDVGRPYAHPAIIATLREILFGARPAVRFPRSYFVDQEAALKAYQLGEEATSINFHGNTFEGTFRVHMASLDRIRNDDPETYAGFTAWLYDEASGESSTSLANSGQAVPIAAISAAEARKNFVQA
ncbi:hypothetical protein BV25DRAFT_1841436 [Artomyces pyxidatus]|uniref:Uncharacterized protein n=1 Tax=Artomyces pyxidatus TaxID=48021 RepID=A0ACB8SMQ7_9AGAM|nr:hypothetical protein BV25DRAFT_1841436 [Artomyces pyxidatus]